MSAQALLKIERLCKSFAAPVLRDFNFELMPGEVHALMGSNGAGKSTVCNLITGIHQPDSGSMLFEGQPHAPSSIAISEASGIRMVMQELSLFPTLSIAENLCFKQLGKRMGIIDHADLRSRALEALGGLGLEDLSPDLAVSELGVGQQQLIEIAGAISQPLKLLILDEPTASLTDPEIDILFERIGVMRQRGISVIYISHRMDEISRIADRVSVLRDGERIATLPIAEAEPDHIVTLMAGEIPALEENNSKRETTDPVTQIKVDRLGISGSIEDVSFDINSGEVLGIGGLIGSGRTELMRAIFGADRAHTGGLRFAADNFKSLKAMHSPKEAIQSGIGLVVEDRKEQGLLLTDSIATNIVLGQLDRLSNTLGIVNPATEQSCAKKIASRLAIKYDDLLQPIMHLSGGNQQKALIARWLLKDMQILLFDEPSRGVDASAKAVIQTLIRKLAASGKAIVVVSSETDELIRVSDRILVMSNGRLAGEFNARSVSEEQLLEASFKHYSHSKTLTSQKAEKTKEP